MRAVSFEKFGSPPKVLTLVTREKPEPGPGQVRVKMVLSPIHNHDLMIVSGHYGYKPPLPHVPGTEAVGTVDALGDGVSGLAVGQRVTGGAGGTWAEFYLAEARGLIPLPDGIEDATACQLTAMPVSAFRLLADLEVKSGDWIIQNAANGAVGKVLNRFAREKGVNVVNLVRREAGIAELAEIGIGNAVATDSEGWQDRVLVLTGGAPIVRAVDSISGRAADEIMDLVAENGMLMSFGALSGRPLQLKPDNLLFKRATVKGFWAAKPSTTVSGEEIRAAVADIIGRAARGELVLPVAEVFDLADVAKAAAASEVKGRQGKIALRG
jgi:NADPH:quinone reductase-like Zn-dependent oxidoreductase